MSGGGGGPMRLGAGIGIGIPDGGGGIRQSHCPGALLRVTRSDYLALRQAGTVFASSPAEIREEGYSDARVFCADNVATIRVPNMTEDVARACGQSVVYAVYLAGLCESCGVIDRLNRQHLAKRQEATSTTESNVVPLKGRAAR